MVVVTILLFVGSFGCAHAEEESNNNGHHYYSNVANEPTVIDVEKANEEYRASGKKTASKWAEFLDSTAATEMNLSGPVSFWYKKYGRNRLFYE